jgi:hypothetical protein
LAAILLSKPTAKSELKKGLKKRSPFKDNPVKDDASPTPFDVIVLQQSILWFI